MNRIGADVKFQDGANVLCDDPAATLGVLAELGFSGILVRTLDEAFPALDAGQIREFAQEAAAREMFVQVGLGKVNPYMTAEQPRVRALGGGSHAAGMARMVELCAEHGWFEAWTALGGFKRYPGLFCFDRFRTDCTWEDQLTASANYLEVLAPTLRSHGVRLNIETHEEVTSHEILRLIDRIGEDVLGVCFDPANVVLRGETPQAASGRVAPFTHMTHLRDLHLVPTQHGISRFLAPLGSGAIEWQPVLGPLLTHRPELDLCIEAVGSTRAEMPLSPGDPLWRGAHPDLDEEELGVLQRWADVYPSQVVRRERPSVEELRLHRPAQAAQIEFLQTSLSNLQHELAQLQPTVDTKR